MTEVARLRVVRAGIHASAFDFTSTPSLLPLRLTDTGDTLLPRARAVLARNLLSLSGRRYPHARGIQNVDDIVINLEASGLSANTGAAIADYEALLEAGDLLESMFGAVAPATVGAGVTIAAAGHTPASGILEVVGVTVLDGHVIAFPVDGAGGGFAMGRVASGGGTTTLVLDHPYSGTPETGAAVRRMAVYTVDDDLTAHKHVYLDAEGENWRRTYNGCAPMSLAITVPTGERATMAFTFSPSAWDAPSLANPAHAEPTRGEPIVGDRIKVMIDGQEFIAMNLSITVDNATAIRETTSAENGRLGGVCATGEGKQIRVEFDCYLGDGSLSTEIEDNGGIVDVQALNGTDDVAGDIAATREIAVAVGTEIGSLLYALLPTADVVATVQTSGAFTTMRVVATGTGALPGVLAFG